ncbi:MAG: fibronectin type III domain-containing protein [Lachnospiraceae bacterium]|nr:fibronectin type III domain-containing protein [Lachnospiraceae bacterium]
MKNKLFRLMAVIVSSTLITGGAAVPAAAESLAEEALYEEYLTDEEYAADEEYPADEEYAADEEYLADEEYAADEEYPADEEAADEEVSDGDMAAAADEEATDGEVLVLTEEETESIPDQQASGEEVPDGTQETEAAETALTDVMSAAEEPAEAAYPVSGTTANGIKWEISELKSSVLMLTLSGSGRVSYINEIAKYAKNIRQIEVGGRITGIASGAFDAFVSLEQADISPSVTSISDTAFSGCPKHISIIGDFGTEAERVADACDYSFIARTPVKVSTLTVRGIVDVSYTGSPVTQDPVIEHDDRTLKENEDYQLTYSNNIEVGTATVKITGIGNYAGTRTLNFYINRQKIGTAYVKGIQPKVYTGSAIKPAPYIKLGKALKRNVDYKLSWKNNVNPGTATVIITGIGNYQGTTTKTFKINKADLSGATVTGVKNLTWTGKARTQSPTVKLGKKVLTAGKDYRLSYSNNINPGKASMTVTGINGYKGTIRKTFTISVAVRSISNASVTGVGSKIYTGKAITQSPVVKLDGTTLREGTDYRLSYSNNVNAGTATLTISGTGNYKDETRVTFRITRRAIRKASVSGLYNKIYTGRRRTQTPTLRYNGRVLRRGTDYSLSYKNNLNAGTATMIISGLGNFQGTRSISFRISPKSLSKASIASIDYRFYTGSRKTPSPGVSLNGTRLRRGTDYYLTYTNNLYVGRATVTIHGKGNYSGSVSKRFTILPHPVSLTRVTPDGNGVRVEWETNNSQTTGYRVEYSTNSSFRSNNYVRTITGSNIGHTTLKDLTSGRIYYVRVQAYRVTGGSRFYSSWSRYRTVVPRKTSVSTGSSTSSSSN